MRFERHFVAIAATALALTACGGGGGESISKITADEPSLGKADAPVTFVEYASTSCAHCAHFNNEVFHAFKEKHIDTGEVRYAMREILTPPYEFASAAFLVASCVPQEKYYPVIDAVFRGQNAILTSGNPGEGLKQIALSAGLSEEQYRTCVLDDAKRKALEARVLANSKAAKIESTPTFFMNGKKLKLDANATLEELSKAVADAKAAAK